MNGADLAVLVVPFLDGSSNRVEAGTDLEVHWASLQTSSSHWALLWACFYPVFTGFDCRLPLVTGPDCGLTQFIGLVFILYSLDLIADILQSLGLCVGLFSSCIHWV